MTVDTKAAAKGLLSRPRSERGLARVRRRPVGLSDTSINVRGEDTTRNYGWINLWKGNRTHVAITDKRIVARIPEVFGNDILSIPYYPVTDVDLNTGIVRQQLVIETRRRVYEITSVQP